jgi:hypothetical protein
MAAKTSNQQFSKEEANQRFEKLVQAALNTRPKPLKSMTRKGVPAQRKRRKKSSITAE